MPISTLQDHGPNKLMTNISEVHNLKKGKETGKIWVTTVDGFRNPVNSPVDVVVYPIIYRVLYISGGCLGVLAPSTVSE